MDFLKSAVASAISKGPPFPYSFGDRLDLDQSFWTLNNGTKREDGSKCSIFSFDITANKSRLPLARNAVRKLKTLRHPGVVRVLESVETETYIYVATERVTPLRWHVRRKSLSPETIKWGLFTIASTLKFINDEASSVHGCIRVSSVFTSESGEWRLGGLDLLSSMKEDDAVIYTYAGMVSDVNRYAPPEISKTGWDAIKRNPVSAVDSYQFGLLIFEAFNGGDLGMGASGQTTNVPPSIAQAYKRLLNANPKARMSVSNFLDQGRRSGGFFETPLINLSQGVESMGLKSDEERAELLSELDEVSDDFPEDFFKMKILPELLKSVEYGGGGPKVFNFVMKIGSKLSDDDWESMLNPALLRLFASPDRRIRVCLLDNLPIMIEHFPQKAVNDKIFPQMAAGFTDTAPVIREQSVKSVLTIITKLSDRTINGDLLRYLAKTANDEQPGIRTNTMICLGKIARSFGTSTRTKVLIAAFTRSLRDPFVHSRTAALQALAATADLFSEEDGASKIMPAICPSLIDKEKLVRDQAGKTLDVYLTRIRKFSATMPDTVLPPPSVANANGPVPRMGTPQSDTSWAGWAISSFTNKIAAASGEIQPKLNGQATPTSITSPKPLPPSSSHNLHRQALTNPASRTFTPPPSSSAPSAAPASENDADDTAFDDAWGDSTWSDNGDDEAASGEAFFDALASKAPSAGTPTTASATSPTPYDDGGEPDFAGWLNAQAQAKSKHPLPKGLGRPAGATPAGKGAAAAKAVKKGIPARPAIKESKTAPGKVIDTKPKETAGDDDWGDAWD